MDDIFVPSTWKRLWALGIDQMVMLLFYFPFAKKFFQVFFTDDDVYISLVQLFVLFMVPAIYEFIFLVIMQATPGKWMMGLKVVPRHNPYEELDLSQCVLRPLTSRLSFLFGWAIYAVAFFRYDRTHLADWVAETRVIQFTPRVTRAGLRPFLASLLLVCYTLEGLSYATSILNQIDWKNKQVELRALMEGYDVLSDFQLDDGDDDDF